jgi:2-polyprenyl-6-methoxyphenol hydroxylase-like FAD-dependent oxidoreductase
MAGGTYDIITVGGGLGGATLAKAMAEHGAQVLVLERERQFRDRVRGEVIAPWGVAEAQELGIDMLLRSSCGQDLPLIAQDPTRAPDHAWSGPDLPFNETVRRRFFGEE